MRGCTQEVVEMWERALCINSQRTKQLRSYKRVSSRIDQRPTGPGVNRPQIDQTHDNIPLWNISSWATIDWHFAA